jgi:hypothetical protein
MNLISFCRDSDSNINFLKIWEPIGDLEFISSIYLPFPIPNSLYLSQKLFIDKDYNLIYAYENNTIVQIDY